DLPSRRILLRCPTGRPDAAPGHGGISRNEGDLGFDIVTIYAEDPTDTVPTRHFQDHAIVLCVRWYLRYCVTSRDLEELMAERGLAVDHSTIGRWVLRYAPELHKRIRRDTRTPNRSWRVDETYFRVAGRWTLLPVFLIIGSETPVYLCRAAL